MSNLTVLLFVGIIVIGCLGFLLNWHYCCWCRKKREEQQINKPDSMDAKVLLKQYCNASREELLKARCYYAESFRNSKDRWERCALGDAVTLLDQLLAKKKQESL